MDFQQLWLDTLAEEKNESDPQVPHVFSAKDMPLAAQGVISTANRGIEDAEYFLLSCRAASHTHKISLYDVGGIEGRDTSIHFLAFEQCCQHPMLSQVPTETLRFMRERCKSDTIMTVSFVCDVTPSGKFISTPDGIRLTGTNLEEDRILYVTSDRGRVHNVSSFDEADYEGVLHRMMLNSHENISRREDGFRHTRCPNVSRSAVLALLKIGEAMVDTVQNLVIAIKSGVSAHEIVWKENGVTITAQDMRATEGFDHLKDCERKLGPLIKLLLGAANKEVVGARKGVPPPINFAKEEQCIERRLTDYFKAVLLNHPSRVSRYAMRSATLSTLIEVVGIELTLYSLCTSSLAKEFSSRNNEKLYTEMKLESILGLKCHELQSMSKPLDESGNEQRTRRTLQQVRRACQKAADSRPEKVVKEEELLHDPEVLKEQYETGNLELDLLRISDHLVQCRMFIDHDTEIRMLNLLAIGGGMIRKQLELQGHAHFYGATVTTTDNSEFCLESDSGIKLGFVNLKALTCHSAVFGAMLSFMQGGPVQEVMAVKNPVRTVAERTLFVRDTFRCIEARGLTQARAIEVAVMVAKILSIRRAEGFDKRVLADHVVIEALLALRGCVEEKSTGLDVVDLVRSGSEETVEHYGVDSSLLSAVKSKNLSSSTFELLDYTKNCHLYRVLDVPEDAVEFSAAGQKYFAYCHDQRVHVRKKGLFEELRHRLGGNKIALTVLGSGLEIELKNKEPLHSDSQAMDFIMSRTKISRNLRVWVWSKIISGSIDYVGTADSCMWNKYAKKSDAMVQGRWSVPKKILKHMLVMVKNSRSGTSRNKILVQASDSTPVFKIWDEGLTRYNCRQIRSTEVNRGEYKKAFFKPMMSVGGGSHPPRASKS